MKTKFVNRGILAHASRTIITDHPEDDTVSIRLPRGIARAMFAAATERAFCEAGRLRAVRDIERSTIMQRHAEGLYLRSTELRPQPELLQQTLELDTPEDTTPILHEPHEPLYLPAMEDTAPNMETSVLEKEGEALWPEP